LSDIYLPGHLPDHFFSRVGPNGSAWISPVFLKQVVILNQRIPKWINLDIPVFLKQVVILNQRIPKWISLDIPVFLNKLSF
jgi:hypothetical protein